MILSAEVEKYSQVWNLPGYEKHSPGEQWAELFGRAMNPSAHDIVVDFGCGKRMGGEALKRLYGVKVLYQDIVGPVDHSGPLWAPTPLRGTYGYCCDVLEHIPEQLTMLAVWQMKQAVEKLFLSVSFLPDSFGAFVGKPLHLTVRPFGWWRDSLNEVSPLIEARDLLGEGVFVL